MICEEIIFFFMVVGTPFFPQKGGEVHKRGPKPPPSFGKRGLPPILKYRIYQPSFPSVFGMKITRKYRRVHTEIPNRYTNLDNTGQSLRRK
jgi:hypothetical protein